MFILKKNHSKIVNELKTQLEEARSTKKLLEAIIERTGIPCGEKENSFLIWNGGTWNNTLELPEQYAKFVDDYFGGKVIEQEAIKVVIIEQDGSCSFAFTKQVADDGYAYKLVRK